MWASQLRREVLGHSCRPQINNYKMVECSAAPAPKKKKKYLVNFNTKWSDKHYFFKQSRKGDTFAFCEFCHSDFIADHGGENDVKKHIATPKHREYCDATKGQKKLTKWTSSSAKHLGKQAIRGEVLFSEFLVEITFQLPQQSICSSFSSLCSQIHKLRASASVDVLRLRIFLLGLWQKM